MKKYEKYKESGIEWIGEIPEHWDVKTLKRLATIRNGHDHKNVWDDNGAYPIFGSGGIFGKSKDYLHEGPSVILGRKGTIDKPQFVETPFWSVDTAYYTDINSNVNPKLFYYLCTTINFDLYKYGSAVPSMTQEELKQVPFVLPTSIEEQTAIVSYLDIKTAEIDQLIADKKRLLELYEEEKTAIINHAVTKGINPNVKMKDSGIEWLGETPEHWDIMRLKTIARIQTGRTPKIQNSKIDFFENGELNWFTPSDFNQNEELIESKRKIIHQAVKNGEVELFNEFSVYLVSIGATLGKVSFFREKASANQQINVISFNQTFNPLFGYYFLVGHKEMITLEADYTTLPILNQSKTKNLLLAVPPKEEQQSIVNFIETHSRHLNEKITQTEKLIELLTEYRTALISEVVTGKVKVI